MTITTSSAAISRPARRWVAMTGRCVTGCGSPGRSWPIIPTFGRGWTLPQRLAELRRTGAWPLVGWAILTGHVRADVELLLVKDFGGLGTMAETLMADDF